MTGHDERLGEQHLGALVVRRSARRELGQLDGPLMIVARDRLDGRLAQVSRNTRRHLLSSDEQPRRELRSARRIDALEQLADVRDVDHPVTECVHVDAHPIRQFPQDRVTGEDVGAPDRLAQAGQTPTQGAQGILGIREQLDAQLAAGECAIGEQHASE